MAKKQQLKYSSQLDILVQETNKENVCQCICCLSFIGKDNVGTIEFKNGVSELHDMFERQRARDEGFYLQQLALFQREELYCCFICEPNIKKSFKESELNKSVSHPSDFILKTLACVQEGKFEKNNFFSVFKGCMCLARVLKCGDEHYYHPIRNTKFDILESLIAFLHYVANTNVHEDGHVLEQILWQDENLMKAAHESEMDYKAREENHIMEIISLFRWRNNGSSCNPVHVQKSKSASIEMSFARKCIRSWIGEQIFAYWDTSFDRMKETCHCAECEDNWHELEQTRAETYDAMILTPWSVLSQYIHPTIPVCNEIHVLPFTMRCKKNNQLRLRSFQFYRRHICKDIPVEFQEVNPLKFYSCQLNEHKKRQWFSMTR